MKYQYDSLISRNTAPVGAAHVVVTQGSAEVCTIPLGNLTPPTGTPLYQFSVISDIHIGTADTADFQAVLNYADGSDCAFTAVCGDLVNAGSVKEQRTTYYNMIDAAGKPVYSIAGNHDTIWGYPTDEFMESYTGYPLYYAVAATADESNRVYGNAAVAEGDIFIFLGHYGHDHSGGNGDWRGGEQFSAAELEWFESIMAANASKRRMVFIHPYIAGQAGDITLTVTPPNKPPDLWTPAPSVSTTVGAVFLAILAEYPGAVIFNGHSHYRFRTQEEDSKAIIYTPADGSYTSVHVPSPTKLRDVQNGQRIDLSASDEDYGGEGFIVDVYADCLHLRGRDFVRGEWVGIGTYRIEA